MEDRSVQPVILSSTFSKTVETELLEALPDDIEADHYFVQLVVMLQTLLQPIVPQSQFRQRLKAELLAAMKEQQYQSEVVSWELLILTATVGFMVSVAGLFMARRWSHQVFLGSPSGVA